MIARPAGRGGDDFAVCPHELAVPVRNLLLADGDGGDAVSVEPEGLLAGGNADHCAFARSSEGQLECP